MVTKEKEVCVEKEELRGSFSKENFEGFDMWDTKDLIFWKKSERTRANKLFASSNQVTYN